MGENKQAPLLLRKQLAELSKNPVEGFSAGLIDESDIFKWEVGWSAILLQRSHAQKSSPMHYISFRYWLSVPRILYTKAASSNVILFFQKNIPWGHQNFASLMKYGIRT